MGLNEYDALAEEMFKNNDSFSGGPAPKPIAGAAPADEYDDLAGQLHQNEKQQLQQSLYVADKKDSDREAKVLRVSKTLGLPADMVDRNFETLSKKAVPETDYDSIINDSPKLASWLKDPSNATLGKDDLESLTKIERAAMGTRKNEREGYLNVLPSATDAFQAVRTGFNDLEASSAHLAVAFGKMSPDDAAQFIADANKKSAELRAAKPKYANEFEQTMAAIDIDTPWKKFLGGYPKMKEGRIMDALKDYGSGGGRTVAESLEMIRASVIRPRGLIHQSMQSLAHSAPSLATGWAGATAGAAAGSVVPGIGTVIGGAVGFGFGSFAGAVPTEVGSWINSSMQQRGYDITDPASIKKAYSDPKLMADIKAEALRKGVTTAAVDGLFSAFAGKIFKGVGKGATLARKAGAGAMDVGVQMAGESLSEGAGQVAAYEGDLSKISPAEIIQEGLGSLGHSMGEMFVMAPSQVRGLIKDTQGGAQAKVTELRAKFSPDAAKAAEQVSEQAGQAMEAQADATNLKELGEAVRDSKTAGRMPEAVQNLIDTASEGGETSNVYFQADDWDSHWNRKGESPSVAAANIMGDDGEAYFRAKAEGTQFAIPLSQYVTKTAKEFYEDYEGLMPFARTKVDGMSLMEAKEILGSLPGIMDQLAQEAQTRPAEAPPDASMLVKEQVSQQLRETGYDEATADKYSEVLKSTFNSLAERTGQNAKELFDKYGLQISRRDTQRSNESTEQYNQRVNDPVRQEFVDFLASKGKAVVRGQLIMPYMLREAGASPEMIEKLNNYNKPENDPANQLLDVYRRKSFNQDIAPAFYSKLAQTVEQKMGNSASVEQINGMLKEIKPEERKWMGLDSFLSGKEKVSKVELQEFLKANALEIQEVVKQDNRVPMADMTWDDSVDGVVKGPDGYKIVTLASGRYSLQNAYGMEIGEYTALDSAKFDAAEHVGESIARESGVSRGTKFGSYTLPGGENYREVLFTLPEDKNAAAELAALKAEETRYKTARANITAATRQVIEEGGDWQKAQDIALEKGYITQGDIDAVIDAESGKESQREISLTASRANYSSSHYDEKNVLAHTRLNDRVDADGKKVLFIEEIQSDWHQGGRKKGYAGDISDAVKNEKSQLEAEKKELLARYGGGLSGLLASIAEGNSEAISDRARNSEILKRLDEISGLSGDSVRGSNNAVPDAPFRKTWHEFTMKRLIREAAEKGYDKIAWTTGEQQADRYDLSKQVDGVTAKKNADGTFQIKVFKNDEVLHNVASVKTEDLEAQLGKDLAAKIVAESGRVDPTDKTSGELEYTGVDLKVGGEGMKGFYDKILVDFANKFGKKYGAKVDQTQLSSDPNSFNQNESDRALLSELNDVNITTVHSLTITPELRNAALNEGFSMFQREPGEDPRGQITFGNASINIDLLPKANLSTFLHETGHFYFEVLRDISTGINTTPELQSDFATLLDHAGFSTIEAWDAATPEQQTEGHEKIARSFEAYLMEGKAPSQALREAFTKFRSWLTSIYRTLANLNVELSPEVRGVFDRMLATDEEIAEAASSASIQPLFTDAKASGMNEVDAAKYSEAIQAAKVAAETELQTKLMKDVMRERTSQFKEEKANVREDLIAEANTNPVYVVASVLQRGKMPDGSEVAEGLKGIKLDRQSLVDQYGEDFVKKLPRPYVYAKEGGLHQNLVAEMFGFSSGDEMITSVLNAPPLQSMIEMRTDAIMKDKYGDLLNDPKLPAEAMKAVHNEKRSQLLRKEIEYMASEEFAAFKGLTKRMAIRLPSMEAIKQQAADTIARTKVRDVSPIIYQRAESKASKEAMAEFLRGDFEKAFSLKQRELLNHELYRAAVAAKEKTDKIVTYMNRFTKLETRKKLGLAGEEYLHQIDTIMERFEFVKGVSLSKIDRRQSLAKWYEAQVEMGVTPIIPDKVLNEAYRISYKEMSVDELSGIYDAAKNIAHLSRLKNEFLNNERQRNLKEAREGFIASIVANSKGERPVMIETRRQEGELRRMGASYLAEHRKLSNIVREMDGWKDGGVGWDLIVRPLNDAANREADMNADATSKFQKIFSEFQAKDLKGLEKFKALAKSKFDLSKKTFIPELKTNLFDGNISKEGMLSVALNYGNEDSRTKLLEGMGWTETQVQSIFSQFNDTDWNFVEGMWDQVNSYWGEASAMSKRVDGIAPAKVEASPFMVMVNGVEREIKGGYYPLKYDSRRAPRAFANEAKDKAKAAMGGAAVRSSTAHGHRKERVAGVQMPIRLDLGVATEHVASVIHDLTHFETLIDVNRIIGSKDIQEAMLSHYGDILYGEIRDAVQDIATGQEVASTAVEKSMSYLRSGMTFAAMGWNLNTVLQQPLGLTQSMFRIGPKWVAKGIGKWLGSPQKMSAVVGMVQDKSSFMKSRGQTQDREINEIRNGVNASEWKSNLDSSYLYLIQKGQMMADIPTWLGAYEKAQDQQGQPNSSAEAAEFESRSIALADQAVIDSQSGGQIKDLAKIQRKGGPLMKVWTAFYSYFSATYNNNYEAFAKTDFHKPDDIGRLAVDLFMLNSLPAILGMTVTAALKGELPDDAEEFAKQAAQAQASYILGNFIGIRELGGVVSGFNGYEGPAGARFFSEAAKLGKNVIDGKGGEALGRSANKVGGILFHYPSGQLDRTWRGFNALSDGKTKNPMAIIMGPPYKKKK